MPADRPFCFRPSCNTICPFAYLVILLAHQVHKLNTHSQHASDHVSLASMGLQDIRHRRYITGHSRFHDETNKSSVSRSFATFLNFAISNHVQNTLLHHRVSRSLVCFSRLVGNSLEGEDFHAASGRSHTHSKGKTPNKERSSSHWPARLSPKLHASLGCIGHLGSSMVTNLAYTV